MELIKYASILSSVILVVVGLIKLPITKFKDRAFYKPLLTILTIILVVGASVICQTLILHDKFVSVNMLLLIFLTFGETMLSYNGIYEGCKIKDLVKKMVNKFKETNSAKNKLTKYAEKVGLDNAVKIVAEYISEKKEEIEAVKNKEIPIVKLEE